MKIRVLALAALLAAAPTAVFARKELPAPLAAELPVVVTFDQREIAVDVIQANGVPYNPNLSLVGDLAANLIVIAIAAKQQHDAAVRGPVIAEIVGDYDFQAKMTEQLRTRLASEGISANPQFQFRSIAPDAANPDAKVPPAVLPDNGVAMYILPHYAMAHTAQKLIVYLHVAVVERAPKENGKVDQKVLLSQIYSFELLLDRSFGKDPDKNLDRWRGIGREALRKQLDLGIAQAVDMLVYDLSPAGRTEREDGIGLRERTLYDDINIMGRKLRDADNITWVRTTDKYGIKGGINAEPDGPKPVAASAPAEVPAAEAPATPAPAPSGAN